MTKNLSHHSLILEGKSTSECDTGTCLGITLNLTDFGWISDRFDDPLHQPVQDATLLEYKQSHSEHSC